MITTASIDCCPGVLMHAACRVVGVVKRVLGYNSIRLPERVPGKEETEPMNRPFASVTLVVAAYLAGIPALAETDIRSERVQFQANTSGASINDKIKGREIVDYLLGARAGQTLSVSMQTDNGANYFNVIPPDADDGDGSRRNPPFSVISSRSDNSFKPPPEC
jgi:hypothetical protein